MSRAAKGRARRLPKALRPGDLIGLVAPSGSTKDAEAAAKGKAALEKLGFRVKVGASALATRYGYLAAPDELRAADLNAFFGDPEVDGIVCLKGGYGTPRILDRLDYGAMASSPKLLIGYSDITGLHLAFDRYVGYPTMHGPMAMSMASGWNGYSRDSWLRAATADQPLGELRNPEGEAAEALVGGKARGRLIGGNLSLVAALCGTPYALEPEGAIVFLEDVGEEPYRVDRMLNQLRLAGVFERCAAVALGGWTDCGPEDPERSLTLREVFMDQLAPSGKPVMAGLAAGHCAPTMSLPFGVAAELDADAGRLVILEAACRSPGPRP